jgi:hypothetical protein
MPVSVLGGEILTMPGLSFSQPAMSGKDPEDSNRHIERTSKSRLCAIANATSTTSQPVRASRNFKANLVQTTC